MAKMKIRLRHIGYVGMVAVMVMTALQIFSLGSGRGHQLVQQAAPTATHDMVQQEHLAVIYEREWRGEKDLLHLQVDTTFHKIGKAGFEYETICRRQYSLREFSDGYLPMDEMAWACFIEGGKHEWRSDESGKDEWRSDETDTERAKYSRRILDRNCQRAETTIADESYQAWYTCELPYPAAKAKSRITDQPAGLILEARSEKGDFSLRAKYIEQQIG